MLYTSEACNVKYLMFDSTYIWHSDCRGLDPVVTLGPYPISHIIIKNHLTQTTGLYCHHGVSFLSPVFRLGRTIVRLFFESFYTIFNRLFSRFVLDTTVGCQTSATVGYLAGSVVIAMES